MEIGLILSSSSHPLPCPVARCCRRPLLLLACASCPWLALYLGTPAPSSPPRGGAQRPGWQTNTSPQRQRAPTSPFHRTSTTRQHRLPGSPCKPTPPLLPPPHLRNRTRTCRRRPTHTLKWQLGRRHGLHSTTVNKPPAMHPPRKRLQMTLVLCQKRQIRVLRCTSTSGGQRGSARARLRLSTRLPRLNPSPRDIQCWQKHRGEGAAADRAKQGRKIPVLDQSPLARAHPRPSSARRLTRMATSPLPLPLSRQQKKCRVYCTAGKMGRCRCGKKTGQRKSRGMTWRACWIDWPSWGSPT